MQMHDTLQSVQGETVAARLATAFDITPAEAEAVMRAVMPELDWRFKTATLSRGGLADLVEALGNGDPARCLDRADLLRDETLRAYGTGVLAHLLGSKDRSRTLAARAARQCRVEARLVRRMLPGLAAVAMATLAVRARSGLSEILAKLPPLGRLSRGSPHADLADILRRRCGAGPYSPRALPRAVRRTIARAAGFTPRGAAAWYATALVRLPWRTLRPLTARLIPERA
jgi:hypothetical protein